MQGLRPEEIPWLDFDRGLVSSCGSVISPCDDEFLIELLDNIFEALDQPDMFTLKNSQPALLYDAAMEEIDRLEAHPDLYPNPGMRSRFMNVARALKRQKDLEQEKRRLLVGANDVANYTDEAIESQDRAMFKRGLKPWEQFLLKDSPGSGLEVPKHPPHVMYQVLPFAGALLKDHWSKTTKAMEKEIRQTPLPDEVKMKPEPDEEEATPSSGLDIQYSLHRFPNLYREKLGPQVRDYYVTDRLENFGDVIDGLEGKPYNDYNNRPSTYVLLYRSINPKLAGNVSHDA